MKWIPMKGRKLKRKVKLSWRLLATWYKLIRPLFVKGIDVNEDFECGTCRKPLLRRYLFCSDLCYHRSGFCGCCKESA